jgi:hypothetical protein
MTFAGTELVPVRSDYHANLIRFVVLSSLVAAALLAATKRVEPTRKEFPQRFTYFFVRCFVTIGFWVAVLWIFSGLPSGSHGEPADLRSAPGRPINGLTVAENVAIPFREHTSLNRTLITKLAALKLAFAGFPAEGMHRYPSELSPSMRKRAALARAIALDPELLFLDEPSTGLDPYSARELDDLIQQLKESLGLTVFIVTHDLDSLWRATDRVAVLGDRSIRGVGTMEELTQSEDPLIRVYFYGPRGQSAWQRARDRGASA